MGYLPSKSNLSTYCDKKCKSNFIIKKNYFKFATCWYKFRHLHEMKEQFTQTKIAKGK
jgi:hypothetical protein